LSQRLLNKSGFDVCSVSVGLGLLAASEASQTPSIPAKELNLRLYGSVEGEKMQLESNQISRDWTVLYDGRTFYVNYRQSDMQTLALCNRDNWEVLGETDDGPEELDIYGFERSGPDGRGKANENFKLMKRLIRFCIENWDNGFMREIKEDLQEQRAALGVL
jgi:hypothetical protein